MNGRVVLYADIKTQSITRADGDNRATGGSCRYEYNTLHNITPKTIIKSVEQKKREIKGTKHLSEAEIKNQMIEFDAKMREFAENLDFEKAIQLRDRIEQLQEAISKK